MRVLCKIVSIRREDQLDPQAARNSISFNPQVAFIWADSYNPPGMSAISTPLSSLDPADLRSQVQEVINLIRPAVQADGGDIELVDVLGDGTVHVRFHGACHGCPSSTMTLHHGIERNLRERLPQITRVLPVA
jgi:Fe-S cluster biogenesis protein NfuA